MEVDERKHPGKLILSHGELRIEFRGTAERIESVLQQETAEIRAAFLVSAQGLDISRQTGGNIDASRRLPRRQAGDDSPVTWSTMEKTAWGSSPVTVCENSMRPLSVS